MFPADGEAIGNLFILLLSMLLIFECAPSVLPSAAETYQANRKIPYQNWNHNKHSRNVLLYSLNGGSAISPMMSLSSPLSFSLAEKNNFGTYCDSQMKATTSDKENDQINLADIEVSDENS